MTDHLFSPEHASRLRDLHSRDPNFGVIGNLWADRVAGYMVHYQCESILDYGCGRSNLVPEVVMRLHQRSLPCQKRQEYDPATAPCVPEPADFVTCIDVLEHVEADKIDAVLAHIKSLTLKAALITVSLRNRRKNNRATHPLVKPRGWWSMKIAYEVGPLIEVAVLDPSKSESELAVLVRPIK